MLLEDFEAGILPAPKADRAALAELVKRRGPQVIDKERWREIDAAEKAAGRIAGRPRVKLPVIDVASTND